MLFFHAVIFQIRKFLTFSSTLAAFGNKENLEIKIGLKTENVRQNRGTHKAHIGIIKHIFTGAVNLDATARKN